MSKVLVTGGCGYIGSHTIVDLLNHGFEVVCIDNNMNSSATVLEGVYQITNKKVKHYPIDLCDKEATRSVFEKEGNIEGIIHFAALKSVGESVDKPLLYFDNNINALLSVLDCQQHYKVKNFIFSSSCSVYGNADDLPVTENTPLKAAESPYARTKQMAEDIIGDFAKTSKALQFTLLRYFNPAGAHETSIIGESPTNVANNLVPVITETAIGKRSAMTVFGTDYDTRDGSCIRDYIHIMDLANAHTKALQYLINNNNKEQLEFFNLGIGEGVSVLEAIKAFESVSGISLNYKLGNRRAGDVIAIYADYTLAKKQLGWNPQRNITDIMKSAWEWEKKRTNKL